ncbi:MAG: isoprenoid biosynthesis glyoxalase ElbB [Planctomycetota bacterium]|nr:MAG: isoprenoid biosynthesis glyoxalase ElbB [Planctomycetota bacterium]
MVRVGVCLSGCGYLDGAEIHESVLTLLALDRAGAQALCFAPDIPQMHVVNHLSGQVVPGETRNVLAEAARIARGNIVPASRVRAGDFDALILPGGYGAAKNLCNFAVAGAQASVEPEVARVVRETLQAGKPLGAICISPALVAAVLRGAPARPELTIGNDLDTATALEAMGVKHVACPVRDIHVDQRNNIVSTPAYMLARDIAEAADGIERLVGAILARVPAGVA